MRNQTKRVFTHKSKVFLTILCMLGLVFSWSCSCKNRVSNPDDTPTTPPPPPGTFSISEATDNVKASIVKSSTTSISDIKIGFVSANNYAYSLTYTVDDANETVEANKITADDFQVANNVLTAKDSVATKMKQVDSSTAPAEKTITINFTFTANDSNLNNNTQTLSVEVKLTHAQKLDDSTSDAIQSILRNGINISDATQDIPSRTYKFSFENGTYSAADKTFTIENATTDNLNISKTRVIRFADYNFTNSFIPHGLRGVRVEGEEAGGGESDNYYTLTYNVTFSEDFETEITQIKLKLDNKSGNIKFIE